MDKLKMQTANIADENFKKLAALFPNAVTEAIDANGNVVRAIDKDVLMQEINTQVVDGREERYQFSWPDKRKAILAANSPSRNTLRPCIEDSVDYNNTQNLYIEGDNLEVLKLLQENYLGKVKMIYIDPPYNTGNDFIYEDDFALSAAEYIANSGQLDEYGNKLFQNNERNGRFHTDWLNFIYPRLKVAKNLLTEDGVIFISIDENELDNLKKICDEVFGPQNFITELIWSAGRKNDSKYISVSHEYIVCYFKNIGYISDNKIVWREKKQGLEDIYSTYNSFKKTYGDDFAKIESELKSWFRNLPNGHPARDHKHYSHVDSRGIFFPDNISWPGGGGPKYEVLHPITQKPVRIPSRGWITSEKNMQEWIKQDRVFFGPDENCVPTVKAYLTEREYAVPYSVFYQDGRAASKRLATLMGDKVFENPKDEEVIQRLIEFCGTQEDDIVMDFFSGSATTAHAVFLANINQQKNRKFILVQLPEIIDPSKSSSEKSKKVAKAAIDLLDSINHPHNLCGIGKERIRRAAKKIQEEVGEKANNVDFGFRVLKLDTSNIEDVYYTPEQHLQNPDFFGSLFGNIKEGRTGEDLLFQAMLELDVELSSKIETTTIDGKTVFNVADNYLLACFEENVTDKTIEEIAKMQPSYFVMRDSSMANDSVAVNFEQLFKSYSPSTTLKVF